MRAFGVTLGQAYDAFSASNLSMPLQPTVQKGQVETIKLSASFVSADDVRNQIIAIHNGRPVYVRNVATVTDGPPVEMTALSRFSFGQGDLRPGAADIRDMPAVTIAVAK